MHLISPGYKGLSDSQENFFAVKEIEEHPFHKYIANRHNDRSPEHRSQFTKPLKKAFGCITPVYEMAGKIYQD
jgi:hypothetical protein